MEMKWVKRLLGAKIEPPFSPMRRTLLGGAASAGGVLMAPGKVSEGERKETAPLLAPNLEDFLNSAKQVQRLSTPLRYMEDAGAKEFRQTGTYVETGVIAPTLEEIFAEFLP